MSGKICCFCGHRDVTDRIAPRLAEEIERHITQLGVTEFWVGDYGAFDRMARGAVLRAKARHPEVKLTLLLPYLPAQKRERDQDVDDIFFPPGQETVPKRQAIPRLNRYMISHADCLIACVTRVSAGAYKTLQWAMARQKRGEMEVVNLGE